jgi:transposase
MKHSTPPSEVVYAGVDISLKTLELHGIARRKRLPNTAAGHAALIAALPGNGQVILESSGGYEKALWLALLRAGRRVSRLNAGWVRHFAQGDGRRAKSDTLDAALLAEYGQCRAPKPDVLPPEVVLQLEELVSRREQLVAQRAVCDVQAQQLCRESLRQQAAQLLEYLGQQIADLDQQITLCLKSPELAPKAQRLLQVRGAGPGLCAVLLATMPELGTLSDTKAAALAGVAPHEEDSGQHRGLRHIGGGRAKARRALYMAALSASRHNPILRAFYQRLINRGKPFKVAITAVMRKLIILLNRLIREPHFVLES